MMFICSGLAWFGTFFAIYWLPFARIPLSSEAILGSILHPFEFFSGSACFLMAVLSHGYVWRNLVSKGKQNRSFLFLGGIGWLSPMVWSVFSIKIIVLLFSISTIYGILSLEKGKDKKETKRYIS